MTTDLTRNSHRRHAPLIAAALAAVTLSGCSAAGSDRAAADGVGGPVFAHVHGLGLDPANDSVYVASHDGLFRSGPGGMAPVGATGRDLMGFTGVGPGTFLSSGHPAPGDDLPNPMGWSRAPTAG